jgi:hypothetical protein
MSDAGDHRGEHDDGDARSVEKKPPNARMGSSAVELPAFEPSPGSPVFNEMHTMWEADVFVGLRFDERVARAVERTGASREEVIAIMNESTYLGRDDGDSGTPFSPSQPETPSDKATPEAS